MKKYLLYLLLPLLTVLCSAFSCADDCEEAAEGTIFKFEGQWCVTNVYAGNAASVLDMSKNVKAYWSLRRDYTYTLCQTSGDVVATFADGVLNAENIAWRRSTAEFEPTTKRVDLGLYKGNYEFTNSDTFYLYDQDGTRYTFSRIKTIKQ